MQEIPGAQRSACILRALNQQSPLRFQRFGSPGNITGIQLSSESWCCGPVHSSQLTRAVRLATALSHNQTGGFRYRGDLGYPTEPLPAWEWGDMGWAWLPMSGDCRHWTIWKKLLYFCREESLATGMQAYQSFRKVEKIISKQPSWFPVGTCTILLIVHKNRLSTQCWLANTSQREVFSNQKNFDQLHSNKWLRWVMIKSCIYLCPVWTDPGFSVPINEFSLNKLCLPSTPLLIVSTKFAWIKWAWKC